jgi:hypothetical protein
MTIEPITPSAPVRTTPGPARHRTVRAAAVVGVAALIAAGGYAATKTFGPDAYEPQPAPAASSNITPSDQVMGELRESVANQYGTSPSRPAAATSDNVTPSDAVMRELRETVANQYGSAR